MVINWTGLWLKIQKLWSSIFGGGRMAPSANKDDIEEASLRRTERAFKSDYSRPEERAHTG